MFKVKVINYQFCHFKSNVHGIGQWSLDNEEETNKSRITLNVNS